MKPMPDRPTMTAMDRARRAMARAGKPYADRGTLEAIADEIEQAIRDALADAAELEAELKASL